MIGASATMGGAARLWPRIRLPSSTTARRSVTATGLVDDELPPAEMPAQPIADVSHAFGRSPQSTPAPKPGCWRSAGALHRAGHHQGRDPSLVADRPSYRNIEEG